MANREFSDSIKLEVIKRNLEKNNGNILCESCQKKILSISECHFDHIFPFAKGGKSVLDNCQILCTDCNLRKNDKILKDFMLEEKAKQFLAGKNIETNGNTKEIDEVAAEDFCLDKSDSGAKMSKEEFDIRVGEFIKRKGDIHKVDFSREYNHLPSIHYVRVYYGDLNSLKRAFNISDMSFNWDREEIKNALLLYVEQHGEIKQSDMKKKNCLPSVPCVLSHYPEYKNFTDIKFDLCRLDVPEKWTRELAISRGKEFVARNGKITQKDLQAVNGLPSNNTVTKLFGTLQDYQKEIGSAITSRNLFISKEAIKQAVEEYFSGKERIIESRKVFFMDFPYSSESIYKRYSSFTAFCKEEGITVVNGKKARYSKREVDDAISNWVKQGNAIPLAKDLAKVGLPSMSVIMKYYENWKEPFTVYQKLYEEIGRV